MPIAKLFIEGNLEAEVLNPILQGNPVLQRGGSKNSLKPRARAERRDNKVAAGYLRDRDFDFDPPVDISKPTVDSEDNGIPFGWRWCRHEIENYLIDPVIVSEADDAFVADVAKILLWFSGKDILAGMADWLVTKSVANPGEFRASLRDWAIANPGRALELLPEWNSLTEILRA